MVFPLMGYPMILVGAVCTIAVPKISTLLSAGKLRGSTRLILRCLFVSLVIGIITTVVFWFGAEFMGTFFYKRTDLVWMIRLAGLCAPLLDTAITSTNLLISIGEENQSFRNCLLQQLILLICLILFVGIPSLHIYGYLLSISISNLLLLVMNLHYLKQKMVKSFQ